MKSNLFTPVCVHNWNFKPAQYSWGGRPIGCIPGCHTRFDSEWDSLVEASCNKRPQKMQLNWHQTETYQPKRSTCFFWVMS